MQRIKALTILVKKKPSFFKYKFTLPMLGTLASNYFTRKMFLHFSM